MASRPPAATTAPPLDHALARGTSSFVAFDSTARSDIRGQGCAAARIVRSMLRLGFVRSNLKKKFCAVLVCGPATRKKIMSRDCVYAPSRLAPPSPMNIWFIYATEYIQYRCSQRRESSARAASIESKVPSSRARCKGRTATVVASLLDTTTPLLNQQS
jgi:hypothetical protein